ncbi:MAG: GNAT family N-acetyltransferase [Armatimonadota bacterium]|nr:GNAT family N-acetyltransferase [bacterium]
MIVVMTASEDIKDELWPLYQEYANELSSYDGEKRSGGSRHYPCFDACWKEEKCTPFVILYDNEPIGFCFIRDSGLSFSIDEFYIRPLHRRRGFGKFAVDKVREHCRALGRHDTITANVYVNNEPAVEFWKSAGFRDTGGRTRIKDLRLIEMESEF